MGLRPARGSSDRSSASDELVELATASSCTNLDGEDYLDPFSSASGGVAPASMAVDIDSDYIIADGHVTADNLGDNLYELIDTSQFMADGNIRSQLPSRSCDAVLKKISPADDEPPASHGMSLIRRHTSSTQRRSLSSRPVDRQGSCLAVCPVGPDDVCMDTFATQVLPRGRGNDVLDIGVMPELAEAGHMRHSPRPSVVVNEGQRWRDLQQVRHMTMSLDRKRTARHSLLRQEAKPLQSYAKLEHLQNKYWVAFKRRSMNIFGFQVYRKSLKKIEGHFGSGIMLYFRLVLWMIGLNFVLALVMLPVIVPQALTAGSFSNHYGNVQPIGPNSSVLCSAVVNSTYGALLQHAPNSSAGANNSSPDLEAMAVCCSAAYQNATAFEGRVWYRYIADFFQGTGFLENTLLFYGDYFDQKKSPSWPATLASTHLPAWYNMPAAYLLVTAAFFLVSLAFVVHRTSLGLSEAVLSADAAPWKYTCKVFAGWDYSLFSVSAAKLKHGLIRQELKSEIADDKRRAAARNRTGRQMLLLALIRAAVNAGVLGFLVLAATAIYFTQEFCDRAIHNGGLDSFTELVIQFLPSALITILYVICPTVFAMVATLEQYLPANQLIITLARIVIVRLATLFILLVPVYVLIMGCDSTDTVCGSCNFDRLKCWETYIGQQMYKLVMMDFVVSVLSVFVLEFPRKLIYDKLHTRIKLVEQLGQEEFNVPVNVMDIVYTQTLCWIGAFFSPMIPLMTLLKTVIIFHMKKVSLMRNQKPSASPYRASKVIFYFMLVLTFSFVLGVLTIGITVSLIPPSQGCGPFRVYNAAGLSSIFASLRAYLRTTPHLLQDVVHALTSYVVQIPLICTLSLLIYFFVALSKNSSRRIEILKLQLTMETQNKDYLVRQVNKALKKELCHQQRTTASVKLSN